MTSDKGKINAIFGVTVILLAAVVAVSMYFNRDQAPVQDAVAPGVPSNAPLPEGHPSVDSSNKIASMEQMSQGEPQNADLKTQLGNAYYDAGQYQKAADAYEQSLKLQPQNAGVETDLATCYHFLGQHDKALATLDKVLKYHPGFPQALFNKGIVLQATNDAKGAIAAWQSLLASDPNFPQRADIEQRINQLKSSGR